jgi:hypothetical protein
LGFNHGKAPEVGAKWIADQKPDIVALQELNGFKQGTLEKIARKWNHDHAIILKEKDFPVGLTANSKMTIIEKRLDGMWHGYLHCEEILIATPLSTKSGSTHGLRMTRPSTKRPPSAAQETPIQTLPSWLNSSPSD